MHTVTCKTIPSHIWNIWDRNMQRDGENEPNETEGQRENKTRKDRETERDKWTRQKETKRNAMEYVWNIHTPDKKKKREATGKTQHRTYTTHDAFTQCMQLICSYQAVVNAADGCFAQVGTA